MSQIAQCSAPVDSVDDSPVILQHPVVARRLASFEFEGEAEIRQTPVARARLEHHNRSCPQCRRVSVRLVELDDALLDRRGLEIPGTATVVGFYCLSCRHEWASSADAGRVPRPVACNIARAAEGVVADSG